MAKENSTYFCDISRLGKIHVSGASAPEFIRVMTTVEPWRVETPGQAARALVLNGEGEILDLIMIARTGEQEFLLIGNAEPAAELVEWLQAHAKLADNEGVLVFEDIEIQDSTAPVAALALYGPEAQMVLDELSAGDVSEELGDKSIALVTIGKLPVMVLRWPWLNASAQDMPLVLEGEVFELYFSAQVVEEFKTILLGFAELDPESYDEYVDRRQKAHTWFGAAEDAAYLKPETAGLLALLRTDHDFVGAKALKENGLL